MNEIGGVLEQQATFDECFTDEGEVKVRQVADTTMNKLGGFAAGATGEVGFFDEGNLTTTSGGVEGDAGTSDTATDNEDVEVFARKSGEVVEAVRCG